MKFNAYLKEKGINLRDISVACGIPYATLHNNVENPTTMKAENLMKISKYVGLSMETIFSMMLESNSSLLNVLLDQKRSKLPGNLYHYTQIAFAYNSNRIEGSQLTEDETRYIFETNTLIEGEHLKNVDDVVEAANHFYLFDKMLEEAELVLSEKMIKEYHKLLKNGTVDSRKEWFNVGDYKQLPNQVGGQDTTAPEKVHKEIKKLLAWYTSISDVTINDIVEFHYRFECIHPFQDGNGRLGRVIMFKECLKHNIIPFIIEDRFKTFYYRGLAEYDKETGWLMDTCLSMQDAYNEHIAKFLPKL